MSNVPKALDPFWEYGEAVGGANRAYISCKLCGTKMSGGVTRLKYHLDHLARLPAHDADVMPCMVSSAEVIQKALEAIVEQDRKKAARERPLVSDR